MYVEFVLSALIRCLDSDSFVDDFTKFEKVTEVIKGLGALCYLENMKCEVCDDDSSSH